MKLIRNYFLLPVVVMTIMAVNTSFVGLRVSHVNFTGFFGNDSLKQDKNYFCTALGDSISVSTCRFYISDFRLYEGPYVVAKQDYKLIDIFDTASVDFLFVWSTYREVSEIRFFIGVDSAANVSGVHDGELDPAKGMYWAWQSGYINMKLEGRSKLCAKNKDEFQYHLGGYAAPWNSRKEVIIQVDRDRAQFDLKVDVEKFLGQVDMRTDTHVMSPSAKGVELAGKAVSMFSLR